MQINFQAGGVFPWKIHLNHNLTKIPPHSYFMNIKDEIDNLSYDDLAYANACKIMQILQDNKPIDIDIHGAPMSGKTSSLLALITKFQNRGKKCAFFDVEGLFATQAAKYRAYKRFGTRADWLDVNPDLNCDQIHYDLIAVDNIDRFDDTIKRKMQKALLHLKNTYIIYTITL